MTTWMLSAAAFSCNSPPPADEPHPTAVPPTSASAPVLSSAEPQPRSAQTTSSRCRPLVSGCGCAYHCAEPVEVEGDTRVHVVHEGTLSNSIIVSEERWCFDAAGRGSPESSASREHTRCLDVYRNNSACGGECIPVLATTDCASEGPCRARSASALLRWPPRLPDLETAWCPDDVSALDEQTCVVWPEKRSRELVVFLHGVVPGPMTSPQLDNFMRVVARASRRAGVVTLIPRGYKNIRSKRWRGWWGWPTSGISYKNDAPRLIERIEAQQRALEKLTGQKFVRRYVAGSSAGGYFAALLALNGGLPADGYGAMSGAAGAGTPTLDTLPRRPFYIGFGKHDSVGSSARALGKTLKAADWPVLLKSHAVSHGMREIYLDEAIPFWRTHAGMRQQN